MVSVAQKEILVVGLDDAGRAASELLCAQGAQVFGIDPDDTPELRGVAADLQIAGGEVQLGASRLPDLPFELAVVSPKVHPRSPLIQEALGMGIPIVSDLEIGFLESSCLNIAIAGANGKSTVSGLTAQMLTTQHRRT